MGSKVINICLIYIDIRIYYTVQVTKCWITTIKLDNYSNCTALRGNKMHLFTSKRDIGT